MKKCYTCGQTKPLTAFHRRKRAHDGRQSKCRSCSAAYKAKHYEENKQTYIENANRRIARLRQMVYDYKAARECERCGFSHPAALHFHHHNDDKDADVSRLVGLGMAEATIMAEIEKCELICANCHSIEHFAR